MEKFKRKKRCIIFHNIYKKSILKLKFVHFMVTFLFQNPSWTQDHGGFGIEKSINESRSSALQFDGHVQWPRVFGCLPCQTTWKPHGPCSAPTQTRCTNQCVAYAVRVVLVRPAPAWFPSKAAIAKIRHGSGINPVRE